MLEFENEAMCMFQAILGVSEYLYRLRKLELMHDGKIPIMVQERANWPKKIGRNELCPCGSGKKYKRCHGRWEYTEIRSLFIIEWFIEEGGILFEKEKRWNNHPFQCCRISNLCCLCRRSAGQYWDALWGWEYMADTEDDGYIIWRWFTNDKWTY